jgi:hypothetical protein
MICNRNVGAPEGHAPEEEVVDAKTENVHRREGCTDPKVVEFAEKVLLNLLKIHDEAYYTVLDIGEAIGFLRRMSQKDPVRFLS